jgi:hypothetical protein
MPTFGVPRRSPLKLADARTVLFFSALLIPLNACQLLGGSSPGVGEADPLEGLSRGGVVYHGGLFIDGGELTAALELVPEGGRSVRAGLETSSGLVADGEGRVRGRNLRLELAYGGDCPGQMVLDGTWDRDNLRYEGRLDAEDCTGESTGTFRFRVP